MLLILGERLRELREEKRMSQDELAKELTISRLSVLNYEKGLRTPDAETLIKIAKFFNVSTNYLLGMDNARQPENEKIVSDLGIKDNAIRNIENCIQRAMPLEIDRFLSAPTLAHLMVYVTAYWNVDNTVLLNDRNNSLGISFHESIDINTRKKLIEVEISDSIKTILEG